VIVVKFNWKWEKIAILYVCFENLLDVATWLKLPKAKGQEAKTFLFYP
jgi:hypothetical protein